MTRNQYVNRCMDAWLVGWANVKNSDRSAKAKGFIASECVEEFQKKFPPSRACFGQPWDADPLKAK